jgi:hypothetical protein
MGPAGASKTTGWLNVAKFSAITKSDAQFYVLDTDSAVPRMMTGYPTIQDRVHISRGYDWSDYKAFLAKIQREARPQDWVIIDFIGNAWTAVTQSFVESVFQKDIGDYFLFARKADEKALEGWTDWNVINAMYRQWINPLIFKGNYHLYATAKSEPLSSDKKPTESAAVRSLFLPYGQKPAGQKELPFQFHTLLLAGKTTTPGTQQTNYTLTTVKDRERVELKGAEVKNFTTDYLVNVGGWKVA